MSFILTKEYLRFTEFAKASTQYRYIGVCYGSPGVGKTLSASYYANYHEVNGYDRYGKVTTSIKRRLKKCKGVYHTAEVRNNPSRLNKNLSTKIQLLGSAILQSKGESDVVKIAYNSFQACPLVIVDEVDRLKIGSMEQLRDIFDKHNFGLILIGMPGIEKRLMRYPQLYSRIGFAHEFKSIRKGEFSEIIKKLLIPMKIQSSDNPTVIEETNNTIFNYTNGNLRLTNQLLSQVKRVCEINQLKTINKEVIDAARNLLIIGK